MDKQESTGGGDSQISSGISQMHLFNSQHPLQPLKNLAASD